MTVPPPARVLGSDPLAERTRHLRSAALLPSSAVRLTEGPLHDAQERDLAYVLALDVDRLAAPYRREAGLPAVAEGYGNWEVDGMGGHLGGHVLSAASLLVAATGDERVRERLGLLLDELQRCHDARPDGFLGGVPDGAALIGELSAGRIEADLFDLNGRWVPLYNLHKTLSGLLDAVVHAGEQRALPLAVDLAEWWVRGSVHLDAEQYERVLHCEPGGMTEAFTTLGALTGDDRYLAEARRFAHREVLDPLLAGHDALDGLHANTQIPKAVGYEALGQLTDDADLTGAADVFWRHVVEERTVAIGGNSVREHFHASSDFTTMVTDRQGPEGCNTVNMVELSVLQYLRGPRPELVDYVERALFNHVLASQHPEHGGLVYFTPMRPGHYRVYSQPETSMWCCVGSGMEAHARHGAFAAVRGELRATGEATLDVLLHVGAVITDDDGGLRVTVRREVPDSLGAGHVTVSVEALDGSAGGAPSSSSPSVRVVRLRRPTWSPAASARVVSSSAAQDAGALAVTSPDVDGADPDWFVVRLPHGAPEGSSSDVAEGGSVVVELDLPADVHAEALPDGSAWSAFVHGPVVLAATLDADGTAGADAVLGTPGLLAGPERMGHVAAGPLVPLADSAVVPDPAAARVLADGRVVVSASVPSPQGERAEVLELRPLSSVHDERYTVYWPTGEPVARRAELRALDAALSDADVVDQVAGGEQQPESDHHLAGAGTTAGRDGTLHWRSATGWFSYVLNDHGGDARRLVVRHRDALDTGDEVLVDGQSLEEIGIDAAPDSCVERTYALPQPPEGSAEAGPRVVEFRAAPGSTTRAVVSVTLLR